MAVSFAVVSVRVALERAVLEMVLRKELRRIKAGYPFTIGIILVYFILKSAEISRLMTIDMGIKDATTRPVRIPKVTSITASTIPTAWSRLATKVFTFRDTCSG